jgi:hypothetical protein
MEIERGGIAFSLSLYLCHRHPFSLSRTFRSFHLLWSRGGFRRETARRRAKKKGFVRLSFKEPERKQIVSLE